MDSTSATYNFDALGNLKAVTTRDGDEVGYRADGYSRTSSRTMFGDTDNRYIWENDVRLAATLDDAGDLEKEYIYGTSVNSPDYMVRFGSVHKIIRDHLGSVRLVVKVSDGNIRQRIDYNEFGGVISDSSPGYQDFGFAGGIYDKRTKLVKFGARYYDSETGRWLTKDPILFNSGDVNIYGYVNNDPINFGDSSGLESEKRPSTGTPNSTEVSKKGDVRIYGPDGKAVKDVDYSHDHGGCPHVHEWSWGADGVPSRSKGRPATDAEKAQGDSARDGNKSTSGSGASYGVSTGAGLGLGLGLGGGGKLNYGR